jgi:nucleotide-binding universal stress UspA family protein
LVPPNWKRTAIGRNVVVGWNGKREAARAIVDATPFLERAEKVVVAAVDAKPDTDGCGEAPGVDITAHLARKKIRAELSNVDGLGRSHGEALLAEARTREADLIVIGGYGRPRLSEWIFGGVTREILERAETPVLISH